MIGGNAFPKIPTLVWPEGIDEVPSDWLRYLVVWTNVATSSAYEYAKILRPFLRFCRMRGRSWESVDDEFLIFWRERLRRSSTVADGRVNNCLSVVFSFYRWAEETGYLRFHVGIYDISELPPYVDVRRFPISAKKIFGKGRHGSTSVSWVTPLTISVSRSSKGRRHTPNDVETMMIHEVAADREFGERNTLMYSWAEETGARRAEILRLRKSDLPTARQLAVGDNEDDKWPIDIVRKGGGMWMILAPAELLRMTWDWIGGGRADLVRRCRGEIHGYYEPDEVFISSMTGMPLHEDSLTTLAKRDFAMANVQKASLHRLRAKYCVEMIQALVDALFDGGLVVGSTSSWVETILTMASERMGHMSPMSLHPYLNFVLDRKIRAAEATRAQSMKSDIRLLNRQRTALRRTVELHAHLRDVAESIERDDGNETARLIRQLQIEVNEYNGKRSQSEQR
ncbi:integrase [Tardiphaga robiniae]|uniref:site-specific integrase n=1 Tax=Tardiphaga robiniae TaxID=943830 RepID=UPI002858397C|nr:site-specific integrase [Tardiphaga robiniae]MDR6661329.1 integrase [Tardiphaga robiniae]